MGQLGSMEIADRFLETVPRGGVRRPKGIDTGVELTQCRRLCTRGGDS